MFEPLMSVVAEANAALRDKTVGAFNSQEEMNDYYKPFYDRCRSNCKNDFNLFLQICLLELQEGNFVAGCLAQELTKPDCVVEHRERMDKLKERFSFIFKKKNEGDNRR